MGLQLFGDKVLFRQVAEKQDDKEGMTAGGIAIPNAVKENARAQKRTSTGQVTHAGLECKNIEVGDIIHYDSYSVAGFELDGESLLMSRESDIIGKVIG